MGHESSHRVRPPVALKKPSAVERVKAGVSDRRGVPKIVEPCRADNVVSQPQVASQGRSGLSDLLRVLPTLRERVAQVLSCQTLSGDDVHTFIIPAQGAGVQVPGQL